jgi:hypothetical protein
VKPIRDPGWTCMEYVRTGRAEKDIIMRVMFDTIRKETIILHSVAVKLGLKASGGPAWLTHQGEDPRYSSCRYMVLVMDWNGRGERIKARGVSYTTTQEQRDDPGGRQRGFPGDCLGGPEGQPGGGPSGHDHRQGQPGVDARPDAGGTVQAIHPDVDEPQPALHPQGKRVDPRYGIPGEPASEAAAQLNRGPIGGVFCTTVCGVFHRTPAGYTADRKTRRKRNMSCYVLLSAVSNPPLLPTIPPPPCGPFHLPVAVFIRIRRTRESPPPHTLIPMAMSVAAGIRQQR